MKIRNLSLITLAGMLLLWNISPVNADTVKTVRATALTPQIMNDLQHGTVQDIIVTFQQGDRLPVSFQATGDLLESEQALPSYVVVKRPFWIRVADKKVMMSLDGLNYKIITDVIGGGFSASAGDPGESGTATAINLLLNAYLK